MELYKTSDLNLAAYLKAKSWHIRFERENGKMTFVFVDDEELRNDIIEYFNNGKIGITDYKNAMADLRVVIHNAW